MVYTQSDIFTLPWAKDTYGQWALSLSLVCVVYKIKKVKNTFSLWVRCQKNTPYKLGVFFSLAEAQYRVYNHILYFSIYRDGQWMPRK